MALIGVHGPSRAELAVDVDSPIAISFYESLGFQQEGVLRAYIKRADEEDYVDNMMMSLLL